MYVFARVRYVWVHTKKEKSLVIFPVIVMVVVIVVFLVVEFFWICYSCPRINRSKKNIFVDARRFFFARVYVRACALWLGSHEQKKMACPNIDALLVILVVVIIVVVVVIVVAVVVVEKNWIFIRVHVLTDPEIFFFGLQKFFLRAYVCVRMRVCCLGLYEQKLYVCEIVVVVVVVVG